MMLLSLALLVATAAASGDAEAQAQGHAEGQRGQIRDHQPGEIDYENADEPSLDLEELRSQPGWCSPSNSSATTASELSNQLSATVSFGAEGCDHETRLGAHGYARSESEPSVNTEISTYTVEGRQRGSEISVDSQFGVIEIEGLDEGGYNPQIPESPTGAARIELNGLRGYPGLAQMQHVYPAATFQRLDVEAESADGISPRLSTPPASNMRVPRQRYALEMETTATMAEYDNRRKKQGNCCQKCLKALGPTACLNLWCYWDCCMNCSPMKEHYHEMSTLKKVICYGILWLIALLWIGAIVALIVILATRE